MIPNEVIDAKSSMDNRGKIRSGDADVISQLGFGSEVEELRRELISWIQIKDEEMREVLEWQMIGPSKYFRPMTVLGCYRAMHSDAISDHIRLGALLIELFHNVSLIIDDILDHSRTRRGKLTTHCRFGNLRALMAAGYITADGFALAAKYL